MKEITAVCYSVSPLDSKSNAMAHLRLIAPFQRAGIRMISGIENGKIVPERILDGDFVVLQREFPGRFQDFLRIIEFARQHQKKITFDLDDFLFFLPENHPDRLVHSFVPALLPMFQALIAADLVTVSTSKLHASLIPFNNNVVVLPNFFDDAVWKLKPPTRQKPSGEKLTIGYMGTTSHKPDLEFLAPVVLEIIKQYSQVVSFHFWGTQPPPELSSLPQVEWTPWYSHSYRDFASFFQTQSADIFVAPLIDNLFNRCKSHLKYFEYSALGAPGVYSNLDAYSSIVEHGQNGLLAKSLDEWTENLIQLIEDENFRFQLATDAQKTIREKWLLSQNASHWLNTFQQLLEYPIRERREHYQIIKSINTQLAEFSKEKEGVIRALNGQVAEQEAAIRALKAQIAEHGQTIQALTTQLTQARKEIEQLKIEIMRYVLSKSWRLTRPIRIGMRKVKHILGVVNA